MHYNFIMILICHTIQNTSNRSKVIQSIRFSSLLHYLVLSSLYLPLFFLVILADLPNITHIYPK